MLYHVCILSFSEQLIGFHGELPGFEACSWKVVRAAVLFTSEKRALCRGSAFLWQSLRKGKEISVVSWASFFDAYALGAAMQFGDGGCQFCACFRGGPRHATGSGTFAKEGGG